MRPTLQPSTPTGGRSAHARRERDRRRRAPPARDRPARPAAVAARAQLDEAVLSWYPAVTEAELDRIAALVDAYCDSELAQRLAALPGARTERPFAFEHDGVLFHGRLDVLWLANGKALVADYKSNVLDGADPTEVVEAEYHLQRLVYALACLRAGAEEAEIVYQFLERPSDLVSATFSTADVPALEAELSAGDRAHPQRETSARRRASSPVRAARRSTSSARGPVCSSTGSFRRCGSPSSPMSTETFRLSTPCWRRWGEGVDAIVCAGDLVGGPFSVEVFDRLASMPQVRFVRGNADRQVLEGTDEYGIELGSRAPAPRRRAARPDLDLAADLRARRRWARADAFLSCDPERRRADLHAHHARRCRHRVARRRRGRPSRLRPHARAVRPAAADGPPRS